MPKVTQNEIIEYVDAYVHDSTAVIIQHERKIKKLTRLFFMSLLGFSALGTYLVVKTNK